jgi:hypothetical protein
MTTPYEAPLPLDALCLCCGYACRGLYCPYCFRLRIEEIRGGPRHQCKPRKDKGNFEDMNQ